MECVEGVGTIDKGVLACGKGNRDAGAWVARVRVSAHTVWMWSSFPLLGKLQMNHMLPMLRSPQMCHILLRRRNFLKKHCNSQKKCRRTPMMRRNLLNWRKLLGRHRRPMRHKLGALCMSLVVRGLWWGLGSVHWPVREVAEEDWCRRTGDTGIVADIVDTVGTDAFAGSILNTIYKAEKKNV